MKTTLTLKRQKRILDMELQGLAAISRGNYLLTLAWKMTQGMSETDACNAILKERGYGKLVKTLRKHKVKGREVR